MCRDIVVNKARQLENSTWRAFLAIYFLTYRAYGIFNSRISIRTTPRFVRPAAAHIASRGNFRRSMYRGKGGGGGREIETNKAVTEVSALYDIAPSRTPLLVSMTNRCLLVGSVRRRHSTLRPFHEKPGRHLSFSRVCAPSNRLR